MPSRSYTGQSQELVFDLGKSATITELKYGFCVSPGFSNGHVKDFELSVAQTIDGTYTPVVAGTIPEHGDSGSMLPFPIDGSVAATGQFWKWTAMNNHGNGAYIWTCEVELYEADGGLLETSSERRLSNKNAALLKKHGVSHEEMIQASVESMTSEMQNSLVQEIAGHFASLSAPLLLHLQPCVLNYLMNFLAERAS